MKELGNEIKYEKRTDGFFTISETVVHEASRDDMQKNVLVGFVNKKKQLEMEIKNDEKVKAEIGAVDNFKTFVLGRIGIRLFTADEIEMKKTQMQLLDAEIKKVEDILK